MREPMILAAIVCVATVGLSAQTPTSSPQASKQVTFSGCIEKAPTEAAAAPASPAGEAARTTFILTNASPAGAGAVGTTGAANPATKYRLDVDDAKITPHLGHKVEVTGTVDQQPAAASSPSGAAASGAISPKLKVDSVKMLAASCQ